LHYAPTEKNLAGGASVREQYGLGTAFVVGHIGRFHYAKNHEFLLEVFREIKHKNAEAKLLLVGNGDLEDKIRTMVRELKLENDVIFTGAVKDPAPYYQAMDVMVFPSRYEGLPGTVIEAQAAGLPILISDTVTRDVDATPLAHYLPLSAGAKTWCDTAIEIRGRQTKDTEENLRLLREKGYDLEEQVESLTKLYEEWA